METKQDSSIEPKVGRRCVLANVSPLLRILTRLTGSSSPQSCTSAGGRATGSTPSFKLGQCTEPGSTQVPRYHGSLLLFNTGRNHAELMQVEDRQAGRLAGTV